MGFRLTTAPWILADALPAWERAGYDVAQMPDIQEIAYRNIDLERDLSYMFAVLDYVATKRGSQNE